MLENSKKTPVWKISGKLISPLSLVITLVCLIASGLPLSANAGSSTVTTNADAEIPSSAQLTISPASINFGNANPGAVQTIQANENPVSVTANAQIGETSLAMLTVLAVGDLVSGNDGIPIENVTWTATGTGFVPGTMNKTSPVSAGSWQGPGEHAGTFSFFMGNSWTYATGNYTQTVTYTLTAP